jgi:hypothetical protein
MRWSVQAGCHTVVIQYTDRGQTYSCTGHTHMCHRTPRGPDTPVSAQCVGRNSYKFSFANLVTILYSHRGARNSRVTSSLTTHVWPHDSRASSDPGTHLQRCVQPGTTARGAKHPLWKVEMRFVVHSLVFTSLLAAFFGGCNTRELMDCTSPHVPHTVARARRSCVECDASRLQGGSSAAGTCSRVLHPHSSMASYEYEPLMALRTCS